MNRRMILAGAALFLITLTLYWPARNYAFLNLDDPQNVMRNSMVFNGVTPAGLQHAFTTHEPDYWRPLTWVSFMIDSALYGVEPVKSTIVPGTMELADDDAWGYHVSNIVLQGIAAMLLLVAMHALTGAFWRSLLVAAVFAVHPLRVESVAWITERKDILSGIFAFLTLWAYARHVRSAHAREWSWMALTTLMLVLGLMCKSTLVTLPFALLLLDLWPLGRVDLALGWRRTLRQLLTLAIEKLPLFLAAAGSCILTLIGGSRSVAAIPFPLRLSNTVMSYLLYAGKMVWPVDLAVYYPFPGFGGAAPWAAWQVITAACALVGITVLAVAVVRRRPYILVGWLWFLGMLVPVIGLLQVGNQGLADRFMYLPGIGLMMIVAWGMGDLAARWPTSRWVWFAASTVAIIICSLATTRDLPHWKDSNALYERALAMNPDNRAVAIFYGHYLYHQKRYTDALNQFEHVIRLTAADPMPHFKIGIIYTAMREHFLAQRAFERAIELDPNYIDAHLNLATTLVRRGQLDAARISVQKAIQLNPVWAERYGQFAQWMQAGDRDAPITPMSDAEKPPR